ncbi:MAG: molybdopterin-guanine dinucleotide biosynthesis protein B [Chitinivibrionales bacterium]|nr:molybdopterin-guanine dinucleotide biosynthesis protein B [Chitinivibrionales bacterium]
MRLFCISGVSGSGKTTVVERLVPALVSRGFTVGTIKDIHADDFALDTPGTNTDRHRRSGAHQVAAWGKDETDILIPRRLSLDELLAFYIQDIVIVEGGSGLALPRIVTATTEEQAQARIDSHTFAISGRIAARIETLDGLPAVDVLQHADRLADLVLMVVPERSRCA